MNSQTHPKLRSRKRVAGSRKLAISTMWAATATVASLALLMTLPATVAIAQTTPVAIAPVPTTPIRDGFTLLIDDRRRLIFDIRVARFGLHTHLVLPQPKDKQAENR